MVSSSILAAQSRAEQTHTHTLSLSLSLSLTHTHTHTHSDIDLWPLTFALWRCVWWCVDYVWSGWVKVALWLRCVVSNLQEANMILTTIKKSNQAVKQQSCFAIQDTNITLTSQRSTARQRWKVSRKTLKGWQNVCMEINPQNVCIIGEYLMRTLLCSVVFSVLLFSAVLLCSALIYSVVGFHVLLSFNCVWKKFWKVGKKDSKKFSKKVSEKKFPKKVSEKKFGEKSLGKMYFWKIDKKMVQVFFLQVVK